MRRLAIIGAGIVGLFIGYEAIRNGFKTTIYEKEDRVGLGSSGRNPGLIHVIQLPFRSYKSRLARAGSRMYKHLSMEIGFKYIPIKLLLVYRRNIYRIFSHIVRLYLSRHGVIARRVDRDRLIRDHPYLSRDIKGGLVIDGYGLVDPLDVLNRLKEYLEDNGCEIILGMGVGDIALRDDAVYIDSRGYDYAIVSAGAGTRDIALRMGLKPPEQRYARGLMVKVDMDIDIAIAGLEGDGRGRYTKGGGIIPVLGEDRAILGPGFRWVGDPYDYNASRDEVESVYNRFVGLLSHEPRIVSLHSGVRVINWPVDDYIVDNSLGRVIFLYGIDSPGLTAAPALARDVVGMLTAREDPI